MRLSGKIAVITGGGAGIGRATAELFASEGAQVVVVDNNLEVAEATVEDLKKHGAVAIGVEADVGREPDCKRMAVEVGRRFGRVDVLVNNAGMRVYGPVVEAPETDWDAILAVNLKGVGFCCKALAPLLRESQAGSIVNVSSANGVMGRAGMGLYDATKAGMLALTRTLAVELGPAVRVNTICPGPTLTDYHIGRAEERGVGVEELRQTAGKVGIMQRWAEPKEVAYGILFLACEESSYITGTVLMVDGGYSAVGR